MANDPYWNNVVLAMHMDGADASTVFTDVKAHVVTRYGATIQDNEGSFSGSGAYLRIPYSAEWIPGAGDFTVEGYITPTNVTSLRAIVGTYSNISGTYGWLLYISATGQLGIALRTNTSAFSSLLSDASVVLTSKKHVAWTKSGNTHRLYYGGVKVSEAIDTASIYVHPSSTLCIGRWDNDVITDRDYAGKIDEIRITRACRYTGETITPPAIPFPNTMVQVAGTVKDSTDAFAARSVRAYRRSDGALAGSATSDATTGAFSISALDNTAHYAVCLDNDTPDENALILDLITPV